MQCICSFSALVAFTSAEKLQIHALFKELFENEVDIHNVGNARFLLSTDERGLLISLGHMIPTIVLAT